MNRLKKLFYNTRIIILVVVLILSLIAINPNPFAKGIIINSVIENSDAYNAGMRTPAKNIPLTKRERIISINDVKIDNIADYVTFLSTSEINDTIRIETKDSLYNVVKLDKDIGLIVSPVPTSNIRQGLDLQGGTRVILKPEKKLSQDELDLVMSSMDQRLNVYGLSDLTIRPVSDLSGNQYVSVEIAGASKQEVKQLLEQQGKFEAKISNKTVFVGGKDITYVCRTAQCSGIDPNAGCQKSSSGWLCRFYFQVDLKQEAAQKQAEVTKNLAVVGEGQNSYLNETIDFFLDDSKVDSLQIQASLKGKAETSISITGSGTGPTREEAVDDAVNNMKRLQTILTTGSLPVKFEIVKMDTTSSVLGREFIKNALLVTLISILLVSLIIFLFYRKIAISIPIIITMLSEIIIILGLASVIKWNIDLASIAGIIAAVGTGVDDQVVITDEVMRRKKGEEVIYGWKERIKRAFFVIMAAYFTTVVAMLPLLTAGAGLLKGFAITTILGVSIGVFITRPAYAAIIEVVLKKI